MEKTYCIKHKKLTGNKDVQFVKNKNGRTMMKSICDTSPHVKTHFVKSQKGGNLAGIGTAIDVIQKTTETLMPESKLAFKKIFGVVKHLKEQVKKSKDSLQNQNHLTNKQPRKNTWM